MAVRQLREDEQLIYDIAKKYLRIKNPISEKFIDIPGWLQVEIDGYLKRAFISKSSFPYYSRYLHFTLKNKKIYNAEFVEYKNYERNNHGKNAFIYPYAYDVKEDLLMGYVDKANNPSKKKVNSRSVGKGIGLTLPIDENGKIPLFTIGTLAKLKVLSVKKGRPLMYRYNEDQKIGVYGSHDKQVIVISKIDTRRIK
jgi:hypothetical protein